MQQITRVTRTYRYRGAIDTLGTRVLAVQWKVIVRSLGVKRCPDCLDEYRLWAYATGTSYFSPNDGLLLFGISDEEINVIAAGGMVNKYLDMVSEVRRDGVAGPGGGVVAGEE